MPALTQAQQIGLLKYSSSPNHIQYAHVAELTGTLVMSVDNPELLTGDVWYVRKMNEAPIAGGARTKWTSTTFSIDFPIPNTNQFRTAMANSFRPGAGGSALELEFYDAATGGNGLGRIRSYVGGTQALVPTELASRATYDALGTKLNNRLYHWPDQPLEDPPVKGGAAIGGRVIGEGNILTQAQTALLLRRAAATAFTTLPDAGTLSWDVDDAGTLAQVTLGGAPRNFQPLINSRVGDTLILRVVQDATGGRVITWHGDYKFIGGAVTLNAAANAVTWLRLTVVGANEVLIGYLFAAGTVDALPRSGGTMTGALTLHADPTSALQAATKQYVDDNAGTGGGEGGGDLPAFPAEGSRNNKVSRFVGNSLRWVLESLIWDDPDTPLAASADTANNVLFRGGRLYRTIFIHSTLPQVSYRDFGASDLPGGYTWGGARQVSGGGVVNTVIYSIPGGHFLRRISFGGRLDWGGYNPANWHGAFASEADANANVNNVGDIVFFDGKVQVVTSYVAGVVGGYAWVPVESYIEHPTMHGVFATLSAGTRTPEAGYTYVGYNPAGRIAATGSVTGAQSEVIGGLYTATVRTSTNPALSAIRPGATYFAKRAADAHTPMHVVIDETVYGVGPAINRLFYEVLGFDGFNNLGNSRVQIIFTDGTPWILENEADARALRRAPNALQALTDAASIAWGHRHGRDGVGHAGRQPDARQPDERADRRRACAARHAGRDGIADARLRFGIRVPGRRGSRALDGRQRRGRADVLGTLPDEACRGAADRQHLVSNLAWWHGVSAGIEDAPPATGTDQPGTVTAAGIRNNRSRVQQLSAVLTDRDTITAVTAVRFQIVPHRPVRAVHARTVHARGQPRRDDDAHSRKVDSRQRPRGREQLGRLHGNLRRHRNPHRRERARIVHDSIGATP